MWTIDKTAKLYEFVTKRKMNYSDIAKKLGVSVAACRRKFQRVNWTLFNKSLKDPSSAMPVKHGEWTDEERILLHTMRTESRPPRSYIEIANKLGRSPTACERTFQDTLWDEFFAKIRKPKEPQSNKSEIELLPPTELTRNLAMWMLEMSRWNVSRLEDITRHDFLKKTNLEEEQLPCPFKEIKALAKKELGAMGYDYPEDVKFGEGTYIVVGDSHGKHTKRGIFNLLKTLSKHIRADKIIHIGHALDDDFDLSYCWEDVKNFIILSRREELQRLMELNYSYEIARGRIYLGDLVLANQDFISDYSSSFIGCLKRNHFDGSTVVNMHRQELVTRTTGGGDRCRVQIASPGCLCEPHIVKTIRQIDFAEGRQVKVSYPDSYVKYHKWDDFSKNNWEQGVIIVRVDKDSRYDILQSRIYRTSRGYTTSYFDKIITENGVIEPDKKVFFNGDAHCLNHDIEVFDIQEQFCKDYCPDIVVNLGDLIDNKSCNHHLMERNGFAIPSNVLNEMASANYVLRRMSSWGKQCHLLCGNHERFARDVADRFPQFAPIFNVPFMVGVESLGYQLTDYKHVLKFGDITFKHGDMIMFGARGGTKLEKAFNTFGRGTIIGHLHTPTIRNGCYMVGLSGNLDQEYNEPEASSWMHGFGHINIFEGKSFISLVNIREHKTWVNGRYYVPKNISHWELPEYNAQIHFNFEQ